MGFIYIVTAQLKRIVVKTTNIRDLKILINCFLPHLFVGTLFWVIYSNMAEKYIVSEYHNLICVLKSKTIKKANILSPFRFNNINLSFAIGFTPVIINSAIIFKPDYVKSNSFNLIFNITQTISLLINSIF
jgi:hypothetical protein